MPLSELDVDGLANTLFTSLTADAPVPPTVDLSGDLYSFTPDETSKLYALPSSVTLAELTSGDLEGDGVYDKLMASVDLHIQREYQGNRLTGDQYAKVYTSIMTAVLNESTKFLLSKDKVHWDAITAQMEARIAEVRATEALISLERTKVETQKSIFDMQNSGAMYALTKMNIANADAEYHNIVEDTKGKSFTVDSLMPVTLAQEQLKQARLIPAQIRTAEEQAETARAQTLDLRSDEQTPITGVIGLQKSGLVIDNTSKQFALDNTLPTQLAFIEEQREAERAKTLDTRTDSTVVTGSIGKQKELYDEQIQSFIKDAKFKTAKMYLDSWITQKTLDDALLAPTELQNTAIDAVMASIRATNELT